MTKKIRAQFAVLPLLAALFVSCGNDIKTGSAVFQFDTDALPARDAGDADTKKRTYVAEITYSYGNVSETKEVTLKATTIYPSHDSDDTDYYSGYHKYTETQDTITIDELPYDEDVTFDANLYYTGEDKDDDDEEKKETTRSLSYTATALVTKRITDKTSVEIALSSPASVRLEVTYPTMTKEPTITDVVCTFFDESKATTLDTQPGSLWEAQGSVYTKLKADTKALIFLTCKLDGVAYAGTSPVFTVSENSRDTVAKIELKPQN